MVLGRFWHSSRGSNQEKVAMPRGFTVRAFGRTPTLTGGGAKMALGGLGPLWAEKFGFLPGFGGVKNGQNWADLFKS